MSGDTAYHTDCCICEKKFSGSYASEAGLICLYRALGSTLQQTTDLLLGTCSSRCVSGVKHVVLL